MIFLTNYLSGASKQMWKLSFTCKEYGILRNRKHSHTSSERLVYFEWRLFREGCTQRRGN